MNKISQIEINGTNYEIKDNDAAAHIADKENPHGVTAAQIGAAESSHTHDYAASSHEHDAGNITSGTLAIARGGTGVTSNPSMLTNLGSTTAASVFAASPRPGVTGTLPVANGGTGNTSVDTTPTSGSTKMVTSGGVYTALNGKQAAPASVTGSSSTVNTTVADNTDYSYTNTRYLTLTGANVNCHGFITFNSSYAPTISVSGFTASGGDDITSAAASQVWEFSVYTHDSKSYIIWKNWSA